MREGRNKKKKCVDRSHLVEVFNDECRSQDVLIPQMCCLGREDLRTYHQTMNSSSLAITMFRTPNVQTDDLNGKKYEATQVYNYHI